MITNKKLYITILTLTSQTAGAMTQKNTHQREHSFLLQSLSIPQEY